MRRISVVIPLLNEEENIHQLYLRLCEVADALPLHELEMVFADDGSTDSSVQMIRDLIERDVRVRLISLSRNFGSHAAIAAGFQYASGDAITILSADMQDPPQLILRLVEKWEEGYETVWATRESRDDPLAGKFFSGLYYKLMRSFALPQMPPGGMDLCLVDRQVVDSLGRLNERNTSIFCLIMWAGFKQCFIPYHREARKAGRSKWSLGKKIKLFVDSFVAFSFFPIRLISYLGLAISAVGFVYAFFVICARLFLGQLIQGWASLMVVVLVLSGFQLIMLGIVSEYLWRTFDEARERPLFIVRDVYGLDEGHGTSTMMRKERLQTGSVSASSLID